MDLQEHELEQIVSELTGPILENVSAGVLDSVLRAASEALEDNTKARLDFEATVDRVWGDALNLLEIFSGICREAGDSFNRRYRDRAYDEDDYSCQAIIRLHARSCLVMSEVLALLRSGHASGAHARWRTLHELAVVASFLREHDDEIALRYLEHDWIQIYKAALVHHRYADQLGEEPISDAEFNEARRNYETLVAKYGGDFKKDYGWAASALRGDGSTFAEIERATNLDHMRPYYKMASHAIHPNARGLFFDLGLGEGENILLAGPSTRGLADPGMGACIAHYQTTVALLNERPDVDEVVTMLVLQKLVPQIDQALLDANEAHDAEAERRRRERTHEGDSTPGIPPDRRRTRLQHLRAAVAGLRTALRGRRAAGRAG